MNGNTPNYQGYNIPGMEGLLGFLSEDQQDLAGLSGEQIAEWFGFKRPDRYGKFFLPPNLEGIEEGMSQIPALQQFLRGQTRSQYTMGRRGLLGQMGRTGLAGTGSFGGKQQQLGQDYLKGMYQGDRQVQDLVGKYRDQLTSQMGGLFQTAQSLRAGGASLY